VTSAFSIGKNRAELEERPDDEAFPLRLHLFPWFTGNKNSEGYRQHPLAAAFARFSTNSDQCATRP